MTTPFWKIPVNGYPTGDFDDQAKLDFSFDVSDWLLASGTGVTLAGATVVDKHPRLAVPSTNILGPLVRVRIENDVSVTARLGENMPFTLRMVASDGQQDDRTFVLVHRKR